MKKKRGKFKFNKRDLSKILPIGIRVFIFFTLIFLAVPLLITSLGLTAPIQEATTYVSFFALLILAMFLYFTWKKLIILEWQVNYFETFLFAGVSFIFLTLHLASKFAVSSNFAHFFPSIYFIFSGFLYFMMVFFSVISIFGSPFVIALYRELIILLTISLPYVSLTLYFRENWHAFSNFLIKANAWLIQTVFYDIPDLSMNYVLGGDPTFELEGFKVIIGSPCSGIESLVLFTGFFIFVGLLDWSKLNHLRFFALFPLGIAGMFSMSILRIFLLMVVGAFYSPKLALSLFHTNIGWILFVGYFFVFMLFAYPFMKIKK